MCALIAVIWLSAKTRMELHGNEQKYPLAK